MTLIKRPRALNSAKGLLLLALCSIAMPMQAQTPYIPFLEDYFPENYFSQGNNTRWDHLAGEVVYYMRLAEIPPLMDKVPEKGTTILRINLLPPYAHPLFVEVTHTPEGSIVRWQKGNAIAGYVEHSSHYEMGDSGWVDVTDKYHRGNEWVKGIHCSGERLLNTSEWVALEHAYKAVDLPRHPHTDGCWNTETTCIVEYRDSKCYNAWFAGRMIWDEKDSLMIRLITLADSSYADMMIHSLPDVEASFPGGADALKQFLDTHIQYPPKALQELEEGQGNVSFLVERDGSLFIIDNNYSPDTLGFHEEVLRVVKQMPRWIPAVNKGRTVRSQTHCNYLFTLPDSLRPFYGHPQLETHKDSSIWSDIEVIHRRLISHPDKTEALFQMGNAYYSEFTRANQSPKAPTSMDSLFRESENDWIDFYDHTPVVESPADSALNYFYKVWNSNPDTETMLEIYLPTLQLEQYLQRPHNPVAELPFDTLEGWHYPGTIFINWPTDGIFDPGVDYGHDAWSSFFWVGVFSSNLNRMGEPVLLDTVVAPGDTLLRFAFYPSFHPALAFRVEQRGKETILYWHKLDYSVDEETWQTTFSPQQGQQRLTKRQYSKLQQLFAELQFDSLPVCHNAMILDGAQWVIERRTGDSFKVYFTNMAGTQIDALYSYLIKLAHIKAPYASEYCH